MQPAGGLGWWQSFRLPVESKLATRRTIGVASLTRPLLPSTASSLTQACCYNTLTPTQTHSILTRPAPPPAPPRALATGLLRALGPSLPRLARLLIRTSPTKAPIAHSPESIRMAGILTAHSRAGKSSWSGDEGGRNGCERRGRGSEGKLGADD